MRSLVLIVVLMLASSYLFLSTIEAQAAGDGEETAISTTTTQPPTTSTTRRTSNKSTTKRASKTSKRPKRTTTTTENPSTSSTSVKPTEASKNGTKSPFYEGDCSFRGVRFPFRATVSHSAPDKGPRFKRCNGVIVDEDLVMVSQSCLRGFGSDPKTNVTVLLGDGLKHKGSACRNSLYNDTGDSPTRHENNIGLVRLDKAIKISPKMKPVCLEWNNKRNKPQTALPMIRKSFCRLIYTKASPFGYGSRRSIKIHMKPEKCPGNGTTTTDLVFCVNKKSIIGKFDRFGLRNRSGVVVCKQAGRKVLGRRRWFANALLNTELKDHLEFSNITESALNKVAEGC